MEVRKKETHLTLKIQGCLLGLSIEIQEGSV